jgi:hypothetical protein
MTDATQQQLNLTPPANQADGSQAALLASQPGATSAATQQQDAPKRPDGLLDKFWNP